MVRNIPLFGIYHDFRMDEVALEVLHSGQIASGVYVKKFSDGFGSLVKQNHVVTVNDMSSAIQIALRIIGIGPGDEVLASSYACLSTNAPIVTSGATPVWVDIDPQNGTLDPDALERAITPRARAVIVYHLAGYPADISRIAAICNKHGLKLIEDCDNALLATIDGVQVGSFGDFAIFSFYPNRQINATEGGALCCKKGEDAQRAIRLRRYGIDLFRFRDQNGEIDPLCDIPEIGWAATLNNLCSGIGYTQLDSVANRIFLTRAIAKRLTKELSNINGVELVPTILGADASYWAFLIKVKQPDLLLNYLKRCGVQASKIHQRTDQYTGFNSTQKCLPNTVHFLEHVIGLPCGWWLSDIDIEEILSSVKNYFELVHPNELERSSL